MNGSAVLRRLVPGLATDLTPWSRANLIAGVTVTAYLVPQVMAYATVAGLPAIVGLWASLPALLIYPFLGSSRLLSLGPESSVALMTAAVVAPLALGDPGRYLALAAGMALVMGVVGLIASVVRLSFISDLLSRPVMVGYMAGIGILMIDGQIDHFLGISTDADALHLHVAAVVAAIPGINPAVPLLAACVLVLLFVLDRKAPRIPGPLLALLIAAGVAALMNAAQWSIPLIGTVPQGFPTPSIPQLSGEDLRLLVVSSLGLLLVGFTDTTLTGRAFQARGDRRLEPTAELRAMSVGNLGSGLLQGMPVSSSGSRTALAQSAGATSQGYSLVSGGALAIVLLVAAPALAVLPKAGLAALVIFAAIGLIDVPQFRALWRFSRIEFVLAIVTLVGVLVVGILYGVLVAVGLSVLAMGAQVARPHTAALGFVPGLAGMHDVEDFPGIAEEPGLLIYRYDSPLFFANAEHFRDEAEELIKERMPGLRWFAINCEAIVEIDSTAVGSLTSLMNDVAGLGLTFALVRAKRELVDQLTASGVAQRIGDDHIYPTLPSLVGAYRTATGRPHDDYA